MSDKKRDIESSIRDAFNSSQEDSFDFSSWEELKEKMNKEDLFIESIKSALSSEIESPPNKIWESVNDQLDIDTVWNRIERKKKKRALLLPLFGLSLFSLFSIFFLYNSNINQTTNSKELDQTKTPITNIRTVYPDSNIFKSSEQPIKIELIPNEVYGSADKTIPIKPIDFSIIEDNNRAINFSKINILYYPKIKNLSISEAMSLDKEKLIISQKKYRNSIGLFSQFGLSQIRNSEYIEGRRKGSLIQNHLSTGISYGLFAERSINEKYYLSFDFFLQHSLTYNSHRFYKGSWNENSVQYMFKRQSIGIGRLFQLNSKYFMDVNIAYSYSQLYNKIQFINGVENNSAVNKKTYSGFQNSIYLKYRLDRFYVKTGFVYSFDFQNNIQSSIMDITNNSIWNTAVKIGYNF